LSYSSKTGPEIKLIRGTILGLREQAVSVGADSDAAILLGLRTPAKMLAVIIGVVTV
jgi:hypothetical protein